jgi:hypothetical protein
MSFPSSPVNNQIAIVNNVSYQYSTTANRWVRLVNSTATNSLVLNSPTQSTSTGTGALIVAGGVGIGKDLNIGGNIYKNGVLFQGSGGGGTSTSSATPPVSPSVGDIWYSTTEDTIYRYTNDGTASYWLDITGAVIATTTASTVWAYADALHPFLLMGS